MTSPRRIDVHFHLIPPFYREAVYAAGRGPAIGQYPQWTPQLALDVMDAYGIEVALTSLVQPGVGFGSEASARALARRCNDYAAELIARWPKRFGAFGTVPMLNMQDASDEIVYSLDSLKFAGVSLFASYGEHFLGDALFDTVLEMLNERGAVVFVHPGLHPSSAALALPWPAFIMEYLFDTTRAAVNLIFSGALERFPRIRFYPASRRRACALFCLAAVGVADDRSASAAAFVRADPCWAQAFLVRQRALSGRADLRRARSRRLAGARGVR